MADWIEEKTSGFTWTPFASTTERQVFYREVSGEIRIQPPGEYTPGLLELIDAVGYVRLLPRPVDLTLAGLVTSDLIPIKVTAQAVLSPVPEPANVKRLILDPVNQEHLALQAICGCLQATFLAAPYDTALTNIHAILATALATSRDKLRADDSSFRVHDLFVTDVQATDQELAGAAIERAKASRRALEEIAALQRQRELLELKAALALRQSATERALQRKQTEFQAALETLRADARAKCQRIELDVKRQMAELAQQPEGRTVLYPDQTFRADLERIRATGRFDNQLMAFAIRGAVLNGQLHLFRDLMQKQFGITINVPADNVAAEPLALMNDELANAGGSSASPEPDASKNQDQSSTDPDTA